MNSSSSSPSRSSISTTAVVGGSTSNAMLSAEDLQFPPDLMSTQDRKDKAILGSTSNAMLSAEDLQFPPDLMSTQDRKDKAMLALKADLVAALNKEVKSLEDDSWKFEGPRSRINLVSRSGGFLAKRIELAKQSESVFRI